MVSATKTRKINDSRTTGRDVKRARCKFFGFPANELVPHLIDGTSTVLFQVWITCARYCCGAEIFNVGRQIVKTMCRTVGILANEARKLTYWERGASSPATSAPRE